MKKKILLGEKVTVMLYSIDKRGMKRTATDIKTLAIYFISIKDHFHLKELYNNDL